MSVGLLDDLTQAERDIVLLAAQDIDRAAIARRRGVKPATLKKQVQSVLQKTGARSLAHLALRVAHAELAAIRPPDAAPKPRKGTDIMDRAFKIGCSVIFFDSHRVAHEAVVTNWFHGGPDGQTVDEYLEKSKSSPYYTPNALPACNVAWVSGDSNKTDPYGRQIERQTSCSYGRNQGMTPFVGMCWCWPDELEEAKELAAKAYAEAVAR